MRLALGPTLSAPTIAAICLTAATYSSKPVARALALVWQTVQRAATGCTGSAPWTAFSNGRKPRRSLGLRNKARNRLKQAVHAVCFGFNTCAAMPL